MSLPDPRENPDLLGHAVAEQRLLDVLGSGRMHHAWLITGPFGVGKATLAYRFARRLLAGPASTLHVPPNDPVFRRVAAGTHADLLVAEREWDDRARRLRADIPVDAVRSVVEFLRLTPAEGGWRVVVVDGAEYMNRNAANALLKLLEEPPPRAVLLLACAAPGRLLPTLRSRCRHLKLQALDPTDMATWLDAGWPDMQGDQRTQLLALSDGSPGRAASVLEDDGIALAGLAQSVLQAAPLIHPSQAYDVADRLGRSDQAFATFMELLRQELGAAVRDAARGREARQAWVSARPLADWAEVWHALKRLQDDTERFHLDRRQAIVSGLALLNEQ